MKMYYQPITSNPIDWICIESTQWSGLGGFYVNAVCLQGVVWTGYDRIIVRTDKDSVEVIGINDDPKDWPSGSRWARRTKYYPLVHDVNLGGAVNTKQETVMYVDNVEFFTAIYENVKKFSELDVRGKPMYGKWVTDSHFRALRNKLSIMGWREWVDGVSQSELSRGCIRQQRLAGNYSKPDGTRTWYTCKDSRTPTMHGGWPYMLSQDYRSSADSLVRTIDKYGDTVCTFRTLPLGISNWPTSGTYRCQIDCTSCGSDLIYGLLDVGNYGIGHFARVASDASTEETFAQDQGAFSGTGLKMASVVNPSWSRTEKSDYFEVTLACDLTLSHGDQDITLQLGDTDGFADGPWDALPLSYMLGSPP